MIKVEDITAKFVEEASPYGAELIGRWMEACLELYMPKNHGTSICMLRYTTRTLVPNPHPYL